MLDSLMRRFHPDPLRTRVEDSIRRGTGLSRQEWMLGDVPIRPSDIDGLAENIVAWCRERIAATRRPYGIDQMALAVACAVPGGQPLSSTTFGVFRPVEFYAEEGVSDRISAYLRGLDLDELNRHESPIRFAAALFSWGDVARETVFADNEP